MTGKTLYERLAATTQEARQMDAPLGVRLRTIADTVRVLSPALADAVDRLVTRLAHNDVGTSAPRPGDVMPPFLLPDVSGHLVSLSGLLEQGPVIVSFHRGHWCPYCRLHLDALARAESQFAALGAQIVAILPEISAFAAELKSDAKAKFHFLCDLDGGYALELNLLFWVGEDIQLAMTSSGVDLLRYQANDTWMLPIPATFVVGAGGIVLARFIDPDYRRRTEVEDLLVALRTDAAPRPGHAR